MYEWCEDDTTKYNGSIVLKFGTHIGSDYASSWLTIYGHGPKVMSQF